MRILSVVSLLFLGGSAFAQSKQFMCLVASADGPRGNNVNVITESATVLGQIHQVGTVEIGRWGGSIYWISWDATQPSVSVGRKDSDGFEVSSSSDSVTGIVMIAKRPGEPETRVMCGAK